MTQLKYLDMNCCHKFSLTVKSPAGCECFGEIIISPEMMTLEVVYENTNDRNVSFPLKIPKLICFNNSYTFILYNLTIMNSLCTGIGPRSANISFERKKFSIEFMAYRNGYLQALGDNCFAISIQSRDLIRWIGITSNQASLMSNKQKEEASPEFVIEVRKGHFLSLGYRLESMHSLVDLKMNNIAYPEISISFPIIDTASCLNTTKHLCSLIEYLYGNKWDIENITIHSGSQESFKNWGMYFSQHSTRQQRQLVKSVFLPLGKNIIDCHRYWAEIPEAIFVNYWDESKTFDKLIAKLNKFRDSDATEDKFLNDFRIIEKMVGKQEVYFEAGELSVAVKRIKDELTTCKAKAKTRNDFARRVIWLNSQKANIEANILSLFDSIDVRLREHIGLDYAVLKSLPKLRNDIAHANEYNMSDEDFYKVSLQCTIFAHISVMTKMGFSDQNMAQALRELNIYHRRSGKAMDIHEEFDKSGMLLKQLQPT